VPVFNLPVLYNNPSRFSRFGQGWGPIPLTALLRDSWFDMNSSFAIGVASGLAAALLFLVVRTGSVFALLLDMFAPLPLLIAALGWGPRSALIGMAAGTLVITALIPGAAGLIFGLGIALPAWVMGVLLMMHRREGDRIIFMPIGICLLATALINALMALCMAMMIGGDIEGLIKAFAQIIEAISEAHPDVLAPLGLSKDDLSKLMAQTAPPVFAALGVFSSIALLWLAASLVAMSGRLIRPWPDLALTTMPASVLVLTALSAVMSVVFDGFGGLYARCVFLALISAYILEGTGVLLVITRGMSIRAPVLTLFGVLTLILPPLAGPVLLGLAVMGIIDRMVGIRQRALLKLPSVLPQPPEEAA
jgi:Predicted membrane protein (DUF2232)